MIRSILIDDEVHNLNLLELLLTRYCPEVEIIEKAQTINEAYEFIIKKKPNLIFLDVKLQEGTGFDLLRKFEEIEFEVLFVSGFKEYALEAFDFNAIDYVIKPIDIIRLQKAVNRAIEKINLKEKSGNINEFIQALNPKTDLLDKFKVHKQNKVYWLPYEEIVFFKADFGNTQVYNSRKECYSTSQNIGKCKELLNHTNYFLPIRKDIIINSKLLISYSKGEPCIIKMETGETFEVSRRKKSEVLALLKSQTGKNPI